MARVKVAHLNLRGESVSTRFGVLTLDAQGHAEVDADVASQLCDLYGTSFSVVQNGKVLDTPALPVASAGLGDDIPAPDMRKLSKSVTKKHR